MSDKIEMTFTISVDIDDAEKMRGENWKQSVIESAKEFSEDLNRFLNGHPFPSGCRMQTNTNIKQTNENGRTIHCI